MVTPEVVPLPSACPCPGDGGEITIVGVGSSTVPGKVGVAGSIALTSNSAVGAGASVTRIGTPVSITKPPGITSWAFHSGGNSSGGGGVSSQSLDSDESCWVDVFL